MTTIAYRDGILAGDGVETTQNDDDSSWMRLQTKCKKVFKLKDGSVLGAAHSSEECERLFRWINAGYDIAKATPPFECVIAIRVDKKRRLWVTEGRIWQRVHAPFYAIGSGSVYAFPALKAGKSAIDAVKIACEYDLWSGGKVTHVKV